MYKFPNLGAGWEGIANFVCTVLGVSELFTFCKVTTSTKNPYFALYKYGSLFMCKERLVSVCDTRMCHRRVRKGGEKKKRVKITISCRALF
jgi:hypothetical protein